MLKYSVTSGPRTLRVVMPPLMHRAWKMPAMMQNTVITPTCKTSDAFKSASPLLMYDSGRFGFASQATPIPLRTSTMPETKPKVVRVRPGWRGE